MRKATRHVVYAIAGMSWAAAIAFGGGMLLRYENTPGVAAHAGRAWPLDENLATRSSRPMLVLLVHPHCPCSRATIGELARLMAECNGKLQATVLMVRPAGVPQGWEQTDLWKSAAAIPGVTVKTDVEGHDARFFGAETSGQALLYSGDGRLLFSGGITESRGHGGDNAGSSAIAGLVLGSTLPPTSAAPLAAPVYGCSLFDGSALLEKESSCRK